VNELQLFSEDLKRLYRNLGRVKPVDNFVFNSLYQVFERYTAIYFLLDNGLETFSDKPVSVMRQEMASEINTLLKAVQAHYGDKLADLEIAEV
jgi:hypothetical protein